MRLNRSRIWMMCIALGVLIFFAWIIIQNVRSAMKMDTSTNITVMLEGKYSIDDGEWKPIDNTQPITDRFHKAVFKGRFSAYVQGSRMMNIVSKNVWYTLKDAQGAIIEKYFKEDENAENWEDSEYSGDHLPHTPGYCIYSVYSGLMEEYQSNDEMTLEVIYPYGTSAEGFSDCFYVISSYSDGIYMRFFFDILPSIIMFLLVCFFGVFFFPIASGLLGRIDFRYIAFGALCFFAGMYMVVSGSSEYMNLWIIDPTVCMMTDKLTEGLFMLSVPVYLHSLLQSKVKRTVAASVTTAFFLLLIVCTILHTTAAADLIVTHGVIVFSMIAAVLTITVMLLIEAKEKKRWMLIEYLISFLPLSLALTMESVNFFCAIPGQFHLKAGLAVTIVYQMVRFGVDFSKQFKAAIHYHQVQRELYEAKVSVMVSQIRPHFMYNALSSIAILCKLNPDTAYHATVAFSDYLRGNMDSLKQSAPVPFEKELEHLKKYLYIEKLRFDDQLNIEYDIQDTNFEIPLLSVQPLVENAVKHGVGMKEDGGTVRISTRETETAHEVIIEDDGVGFDVNEQKNDGRSHIGMENTKKRLQDMCGGEVIIKSKPGEGTVAKIIIPKKEENKA